MVPAKDQERREELSVCKKCGGTVWPEGCRLCPLFASQQTPGGHHTTTWPLVSEALAVHPKQVAEANARAKRHGISVTYQKDGRCIIPDRGNRKKLLRLEGLHDNRGGYGD